MLKTKTLAAATGRRLLRAFSLAVITFTLIATSTSNPSLAEEADGTSPPATDEHCSHKEGDADITMVTGEEKTEQVEALHAAIDGEKATVHSPESSWALGEEKVYEFEADGTTLSLAVLPLNGPYSVTSHFAVLLDQDGEVVQYTERQISENDDNNFNVSTFVEGELTSSQDTDVPHMTDAEIMAGDSETAPSETPPAETAPTGSEDPQGPLFLAAHEKNSTVLAAHDKNSTVLAAHEKNSTVLAAQEKNTTACVATILGISTFFAGVIVAACATSCGIPIAGTPICIGCIAGFATVGAGTLGAAATCF